MSMSKRMASVLGGSALLVVAGTGLATADPSGSPTYRQLAGVGSDTTQDVMNGIANDVTISGTKVLGSYNAVGSSTITTKDPASLPACSNINRPNGSGAGRTALLNSLNANGGAGDGCIQFARSSSLTLTASSPSLTYIPFATDAVSYAVTTSSTISRTLNLADLQAYYHCDPAYVGTSAPYDITPMLPQAGSGTRSYWESKMGIADADVNNGLYPCLINGTKNGQIFEEHTGTLVDDKSIAPYSIAQYDSQATLTIADKRGRTVLGTIGTGPAGGALTSLTYPQLLNPSFNVKRDVYNVIPTSQIGNAPYSSVFVGSNSLVCQDVATIQKYGFVPSSSCGSTSAQS